MAIHKESRKLYYSSQQIFEIIADVKQYPEFLPLWNDVNVSKINQINDEYFIYHTRQSIQLGPVRKQFVTETHLFPYSRIHIKSSDPLFQSFNMEWLLKADNDNQCIIEFNLNCQAASLLLRPVFDTVLSQSAHNIVTAFAKRARLIYGNARSLKE